MKKILALILCLTASHTMASPFSDGNVQTGKKLFVENKCNSCHIQKVGGDGSSIFTRSDRIVHNPDELVDRMLVCSGVVGMTLTKQKEQDLGAYLNQTYYKFK